MNKNNNVSIKKIDFEKTLNELFEFNLQDLLQAKLHAGFKDEMFHRGFLSCLLCFKDRYNISIKDIDKLEIIKYI